MAETVTWIVPSIVKTTHVTLKMEHVLFANLDGLEDSVKKVCLLMYSFQSYIHKLVKFVIFPGLYSSHFVIAQNQKKFYVKVWCLIVQSQHIWKIQRIILVFLPIVLGLWWHALPRCNGNNHLAATCGQEATIVCCYIYLQYKHYSMLIKTFQWDK